MADGTAAADPPIRRFYPRSRIGRMEAELIATQTDIDYLLLALAFGDFTPKYRSLADATETSVETAARFQRVLGKNGWHISHKRIARLPARTTKRMYNRVHNIPQAKAVATAISRLTTESSEPAVVNKTPRVDIPPRIYGHSTAFDKSDSRPSNDLIAGTAEHSRFSNAGGAETRGRPVVGKKSCNGCARRHRVCDRRLPCEACMTTNTRCKYNRSERESCETVRAAHQNGGIDATEYGLRSHNLGGEDVSRGYKPPAWAPDEDHLLYELHQRDLKALMDRYPGQSRHAFLPLNVDRDTLDRWAREISSRFGNSRSRVAVQARRSRLSRIITDFMATPDSDIRLSQINEERNFQAAASMVQNQIVQDDTEIAYEDDWSESNHDDAEVVTRGFREAPASAGVSFTEQCKICKKQFVKNMNEHNWAQHIISRRHQTALAAIQTANGPGMIDHRQNRDESDISTPELLEQDDGNDEDQDQDEEMDDADPVALKIKLEQEYGKWNLG